MSFILDALKKSETERQEQGAAEFSSVPSSSGDARPSRWLWLLAALLAVNFAVLIGVLLKPDATVEPAVQAEAETVQQPAAPIDNSFEKQVANKIEERPARAVPPATTGGAEAANQVAEPLPVVVQPVTPTRNVPTLDQLRLDGSLQLDELHLDIHVYSDVPGERFVFINMDKYRQGARIDEGPVVGEITPDGVILEYKGRRFLLPRQ